MRELSGVIARPRGLSPTITRLMPSDWPAPAGGLIVGTPEPERSTFTIWFEAALAIQPEFELPEKAIALGFVRKRLSGFPAPSTPSGSNWTPLLRFTVLPASTSVWTSIADTRACTLTLNLLGPFGDDPTAGT